MDKQELQLFRESVTRCVADPAFLQTFYDRFIGSSDEVREKFKGTDLQKQKRALADSLFSLAVALQGNEKSYSWRELDRVAHRHGRADQDIRPELYDIWMARLIESAALHDPEYSPEIEAAWRSALSAGVAFMRARYEG
jgi:hemoglobin-like flavoprotein